MPNGECPTGATNREAISGLKEEYRRMMERVRDIEKAVARMPILILGVAVNVVIALVSVIKLFQLAGK